MPGRDRALKYLKSVQINNIKFSTVAMPNASAQDELHFVKTIRIHQNPVT